MYFGYFVQDYKEQFGIDGFGGKCIIEEWFWDFCFGELVGFVRGQFGVVFFIKEEVKKKFISFLGGEVFCFILVRQVVEKFNVFIFDEFMNYFDLEVIDSLVKVFDKYEGMFIFVSYDCWFVNCLVMCIFEISENGINDFEGMYEEYFEKFGDDYFDSDVVFCKVRVDKKKVKEVKVVGVNG